MSFVIFKAKHKAICMISYASEVSSTEPVTFAGVDRSSDSFEVDLVVVVVSVVEVVSFPVALFVAVDRDNM